MNRKSPVPTAPPAAIVAPGDEHAALALREAQVLMAPVARWLLRNGVSYGAFADLLKRVFVEVARSEIERSGVKPTFSALSVLSGVHRKDVRTIENELPGRAVAQRGIPLASQVYTRWLASPRYRQRDGQPKPLPRMGAGLSFETLAREVSNDVHPRTVLEELLRLGLVRLEDDVAMPISASFTPSRRLDELTSLFAANVADHIATGVDNLTLPGPTELEQSLFANGLSAESVEVLAQLARRAWKEVFDKLVTEATQRVQADAETDPQTRQRIRFGAYFHSEPQPLPASPQESAESADLPVPNLPKSPAKGRPRSRKP